MFSGHLQIGRMRKRWHRQLCLNTVTDFLQDIRRGIKSPRLSDQGAAMGRQCANDQKTLFFQRKMKDSIAAVEANYNTSGIIFRPEYRLPIASSTLERAQRYLSN
jgi:hypothetical protein